MFREYQKKNYLRFAAGNVFCVDLIPFLSCKFSWGSVVGSRVVLSLGRKGNLHFFDELSFDAVVL